MKTTDTELSPLEKLAQNIIPAIVVLLLAFLAIGAIHPFALKLAAYCLAFLFAAVILLIIKEIIPWLWHNFWDK